MADAVEPVEIGDQIQARPTSVTSSPMGEYADFEPRFALGRGQFGVVYLMQHRKDPTQKAVDKRVQLLGLSEEQRVQTFKEIKLLANLQHEYIVRYYHSWESEEDATKDGAAPTRTLHILMEYCDGGGLDEFLVEQKNTFHVPLWVKPEGLRKVRGWLLQLVSALVYIHERRIIHRDLKTANVLLTGAACETAKLGDFGISREMSTQTNFAKTAVGTPYYLSPELITSAGYDGRADVWSIGIIIYELITFHRPFHGENIAQLAMAVTRKQPKELPAEAPQDLVELTKRCLKKEKTTRPTSAELLHSEPLLTWARLLKEAPPDATVDTAAAGATATEGGAVAGASPEPAPAPELVSTMELLKAAKAPPSESAATSTSGLDSQSTTSSTMPPPSMADADDATASFAFTCAIVPAGLRQLYQWRTNSQQSGGGPASDPLWQLVDALVGQEVTAMTAVESANAVVTANGEVFAWKAPGADDELQYAKHVRPTRLERASGIRVASAALADDWLLLLDHGGNVHLWFSDRSAPSPLSGLPASVKVVGISCGSKHSVLVTSEGHAYSWGDNEEGCLGVGDYEERSEPYPIMMPEDAPRILSSSCAGNTTLLLTSDGRALSCGSEEFYQLGQPPREGGDDDDDYEARPHYMVLPSSVDERLVQLSCAPRHGAALTSDGRVITWGSAEGGRLGRGKRARGVSEAVHALPAAVAMPIPDQNITTVSTGGSHTVAVSGSGALWVWGQVGKDVAYWTPAQALGEKLGSGHFLRAHAGEWFTLAVVVPPRPEDEEDF